ncbi:tRNA uridine-5-carboxymethylaminomethyl(34) synthesis GTPase MnmE [Polynucleobacter kasalickyi]|uniref:tRNA modification GTPase MnmE n=1 Tax=Polynucleobacter kasalickyi TaxID=1938817 RepID=A0A1W2BRH6_9BURK|nr:tRNA uridine-5-carboxymethylaminomethyl(34) synthesis GTPase MnmE [Polynucleobacter kasalickyi]SMC75580.1 tRNA modification GTPase trmE [Polynucleobacter kasalickyi]
MNTSLDPIVAIATATGLGGIGIVRVSGKELSQLSLVLFRKKLAPRKAELVTIVDNQKNTIDSGIALFFPGPNSFTGEDVLEFQGHGGTVVLNLVLERILEVGQSIQMRVARPGEFSERAFLNNKIDLAQAEAIADLIEASTAVAVKSANRTLSGEFSSAINEVVQKVTHLRILVEATLDFPEEEIDFLESAKAKEQWLEINKAVEKLLQKTKQGSILRNGALVVLAGEPNVGKSSLINQLSGTEVAIVTPIAGTTRDRIKETIQIQGVPIQIIDTAGLRETIDTVEKIGVERSWDAIKDADLIIHVKDATQQNFETSQDLQLQIEAKLLEVQKSIPIIEVWNKIDLCEESSDLTGIKISAKLGSGVDELKVSILNHLGWEDQVENIYIARTRHLDAIKKAKIHLIEAGKYLSQGNSALELFAEELRLSQDYLGEITGKLLADDLLGKIFSSFCIGK